MKGEVIFNINSLNISYTEFETIVWNVSSLDEIKKRSYLTNEFANNEEVPLQLINFLNQQMNPVFVIERWIIDVYEKKKTYDTAMFWLRIFLNENVTAVFPKLNQNPEFIETIRKISPPVYSKLIKNVQNF